MSVGAKTIVFLVNSPEFFVSHRLPLAIAAKKSGFDVIVVSGPGNAIKEIRSQGLRHYEVPMTRSGQNPFIEFRTLFCIARLFWRLKPDLVHLITIKPVLYGGIAARIVGVNSVVAAISGLGTVFHSSSTGRNFRRLAVERLYRLALKRLKIRVIFQNSSDRDALLEARVLDVECARMIKGSGVDLREYPVRGEPAGKPVVVMASRLIEEKGVFEFVRAAEILKYDRGIEIEFRMIGSPDPGNPSSVNEKDLERWKQGNAVTLMGYRSDIADQYSAANVVCLPSYYGEGLPKCLVEAAACGRAVITTDHPGCRDAIRIGESGILVPVRDAQALADSIQSLIGDSERRKQMGRMGRQLAREEFAIEKIVYQHMQIYRELLT